MKMKRRNFLAGLAASAAAALTWRPGAAARSDSGELGDQSIAATNVKPDERVIATSARPGDRAMLWFDGDKMNIVVRVDSTDGPLTGAHVFISDENEDELSCVRSWGISNTHGLFHAGQFPTGKMLMLQVRKDGWLPFEHRFASFVSGGQGITENMQAVQMRRDELHVDQ